MCCEIYFFSFSVPVYFLVSVLVMDGRFCIPPSVMIMLTLTDFTNVTPLPQVVHIITVQLIAEIVILSGFFFGSFGCFIMVGGKSQMQGDRKTNPLVLNGKHIVTDAVRSEQTGSLFCTVSFLAEQHCNT